MAASSQVLGCVGVARTRYGPRLVRMLCPHSSHRATCTAGFIAAHRAPVPQCRRYPCCPAAECSNCTHAQPCVGVRRRALSHTGSSPPPCFALRRPEIHVLTGCAPACAPWVSRRMVLPGRRRRVPWSKAKRESTRSSGDHHGTTMRPSAIRCSASQVRAVPRPASSHSQRHTARSACDGTEGAQSLVDGAHRRCPKRVGVEDVHIPMAAVHPPPPTVGLPEP
jgi:hypothetical protein